MDGLSPLLLKVVAGRFAMSDGIGGVDTVMTVYVIVQTSLRIEEVEVAVQVVLNLSVVIPFIRPSVHLVVDVAILQVGVGAQTLGKFPVHLRIDVSVGLARVIAIVLTVRL